MLTFVPSPLDSRAGTWNGSGQTFEGEHRLLFIYHLSQFLFVFVFFSSNFIVFFIITLSRLLVLVSHQNCIPKV